MILHLLLFLLFAPAQSSCPIRTDGIYTAPVDQETDAHIRFYPEGIVIVSTSVKEMKDVKTWFHKENSDRVLKGKYKIKKGKVKFSVKGDTGEQQFSGTIGCDKLEMTITDPLTKASTRRNYVLIPL
ncbi:MAG: hypothetical protein IT233_09705 [Bacteroidia bacterium]|nr:hypothetical protein [Bacteroidia bacterium]